MLTLVFAFTLFISASLLFVVEPMFAKMVLPLLGGSPAVWNTCVVFFQAAMLAGYAYSHATTRWLRLTHQVALHAALLLAAGLTLPVAISEGWSPPVDRTPIPALLLLLLRGVGLPFLVVSSTAPLLQKWFSRTAHPSANDPYFLYAASNVGSIVALLAYPFVIEPLLPLSSQRFEWTVGYIGFAGLTAICAVAALRLHSPDPTGAREPAEAPNELIWSRRLRWLALAAVPSSLMLGVTTFLSTDVAAMPLLWTIPLALYLLTFVLAFATRPLMPTRAALTAMTALVLPILMTTIVRLPGPVLLLLPLHLAGFVACALVLHGELATDRPTPRHLTEYFLWIAIGGLVGGMFNTLVAPVLFTNVLEYPLAFALAFALRPRPSGATVRVTAADVLLPLALGIGATALLAAIRGLALSAAMGSVGAGVIAMLYAACSKRPSRLSAGLVLAVVGCMVIVPRGRDQLDAERTFFGVLRVAADPARQVHRLFHGSTLHGEQSLDPARRHEPLTYYHPSGPIGQVFGALSPRFRQVAVVGLGAGSLAAYASGGQTWTFYEIDPAVERIARNPSYFTYLKDCGERCGVVLGDARLSLASAGPTRYDAIVLDAFSSDAIPVHLLTRQAFQLYLARLTPDGVLAVHVSNRHLRLSPVLGTLASDLGLVARMQFHRPEREGDGSASDWVIMARSADALGSLAGDRRWHEIVERSARLWTDDYSQILSVLGEPSADRP